MSSSVLDISKIHLTEITENDKDINKQMLVQYLFIMQIWNLTTALLNASGNIWITPQQTSSIHKGCPRRITVKQQQKIKWFGPASLCVMLLNTNG